MELNGDLFALQCWADQWLVTFNPAKTVALSFSPSTENVQLPKLYLNGQRIQDVSEHTHLGVTMSSSIWKAHIDRNAKKANQCLGISDNFTMFHQF